MNAKAKAKLRQLVKDKAIRKYFVEKTRMRLSRMWEAGQTENRMFKETKKRHILFINKIDGLDESILNIVPPDTHFDQLKFTITD